MTNDIDGGRKVTPWRLIGWSIPVFLLLLPLVANAPWTLSDFVVMGVLFGIVGLLIELAVRVSGSLFYRAGAAVAVVTGFLLVWVNLAVGFLGSEDNPANAIFLGVLATGALGAILARFQAGGMARAMLAAAAAQVLAGTIGLAGGLGSPGAAGIYEAVMGTSLFTALWLIAAGLFGRAARNRVSTAATS